MNKQLFKKTVTISGILLLSLMFLSEATDITTTSIYLVSFVLSTYTLGAEVGKKTDWDFKEWYQIVMLVLNGFFITAFLIGLLGGLAGLMI